MTPPHCTIWPVRDINGAAVDFDADGWVRLRGLLNGHAICIERRTARLLAKRINQALDYHRRWSKTRRKKAVSKE
jgi:hypothetical protein